LLSLLGKNLEAPMASRNWKFSLAVVGLTVVFLQSSVAQADVGIALDGSATGVHPVIPVGNGLGLVLDGRATGVHPILNLTPPPMAMTASATNLWSPASPSPSSLDSEGSSTPTPGLVAGIVGAVAVALVVGLVVAEQSAYHASVQNQQAAFNAEVQQQQASYATAVQQQQTWFQNASAGSR
jgi:hypothetical protein